MTVIPCFTYRFAVAKRNQTTGDKHRKLTYFNKSSSILQWILKGDQYNGFTVLFISLSFFAQRKRVLLFFHSQDPRSSFFHRNHPHVCRASFILFSEV